MPPAEDRTIWEVEQLQKRSARNAERLDKVEPQLVENKTLLAEVMRDILELKTTLNRLVWAIVGLALTIAASTVAAAVGSIIP